MKFGGTSVKDAKSMQEAVNIVKKSNQKRVVLLSACSGITDKLLSLIKDAANPEAVFPSKAIDEIELHHNNLSSELFKNKIFVNYSAALIKRYCNELRKLAEGVRLLKECSPRSRDRAASFGELLSTTIFQFLCLENSLKPILIDARKVIKTNSDFCSAKVLVKQTRKNAINIIGKELGLSFNKRNSYEGNSGIAEIENKTQTDLIITQGFIASDLSNKTTTLGRGGSDWSAAILGSALNASEIQIYTDVDGVLSSDPKIIKNSKLIDKVSYEEIKELSFFGAKVVHPAAIFPALVKNIPVRIMNTFNEKSPGTLICYEDSANATKFKSIVLKKDCQLLNINFSSKANSQLYLQKFYKFFLRREVKVYFQSSSVSRITFLIEKNADINFLVEQMSCNKTLAELLNVDLLVVCANAILDCKKEDFQAIFEELLQKNENCHFIAFTDNSLLSAVAPIYSETVANKIHQKIFEK